MDLKRTAMVVGIVLVLVTTALEVKAWWQSKGGTTESRKAGWVSVLNVVASILLIAGQL
ncbi:MAG: hypothetical protein HRF47_09475 [Chloroflexota bacterium]|jgi:hypothetical protein